MSLKQGYEVSRRSKTKFFTRGLEARAVGGGGGITTVPGKMRSNKFLQEDD
jgi:hypothetical protein